MGDPTETVALGSVIRDCSQCGTEREHEVSLSIRPGSTRENIPDENEKYARRPQKVYQCRYCGTVFREET